MIVMKFGGTSNQDAAAMSNVVRIIRDHAARKPIVVISAIAQATNELERIGRVAAAGNADEAIAIANALMERHRTILSALVRDAHRHETASLFITAAGEQLAALARGVAILRELTPRALDAFCAHGELLSSSLVAAALAEQGIAASWFDTKEFLVTTEHHGNALPIMDVIAERVKPTLIRSLEQGTIPVTQGFIGVTKEGFRTTMGRESSDYSASILGAAAGAEEVQIWTDVDGVLTADPRLVPGARKLETLSFEEAFEVSFFGAKVLHPHTVVPVMELGIPVHIYNSRNPSSTGTRIDRNESGKARGVRSIAFKRGIALVNLVPSHHARALLTWEQLLAVLSRHDIAPLLVSASDAAIIVAIDKKQLSAGVERDLAECGTPAISHGKCMVTLIGEGLHGLPHLQKRTFDALQSVPIALVSSGASPRSFSIVVPEESLEAGVRALHTEFFPPVAGGGSN